MLSQLIKQWTNEIILDKETKEPRRHVAYVEVSAKQGTHCDNLVSTMMSMAKGLPSKRAVMTPDLGDNCEPPRHIEAFSG